MTPREQSAFAAGIAHARELALTAAVATGVRDDAGEVRQRAAVAALQGLAAGLLDLLPLTDPATVRRETKAVPTSPSEPILAA